jgi:hypothetical protein
MVALTSATLWSHLSFGLNIVGQSRRPDGLDGLDNFASDWIVPKNEYAFLTWWKQNHRLMAPSLRLELFWGRKFPELKLGPAEMVSFFEYISSALHLEINSLYWRVLEERIKYRYPIVFPNPHTLVKFDYDLDETSFYDIQLAPLPNPILSALRRLSINGDSLSYRALTGIPKCWSSLTHLSLDDIGISLQYWFPLIRAVPDLQWGKFELHSLYKSDYARPAKCTLPSLSTLSIATSCIEEDSPRPSPLSILFTELHLPILRTLSLSTDEEVWNDHRALPELYTVLHSTPAVTTLTLGPTFLSLEAADYAAAPLPALGGIEPVWRRAPCLAHLRLEVTDTRTESDAEVADARGTLVRNLFLGDNPWLALDSPACGIRELTIVDKTRTDPRSGRFRDATMASVREHAADALNVDVSFHVALDSEDRTAAEVWNELV